jgi:hypothetical protein
LKYKSTTIKTFWPAHLATSAKDRWIGTYSIGLIITRKLICPIKKKKKEIGKDRTRLCIPSQAKLFPHLKVNKTAHFEMGYATLFVSVTEAGGKSFTL